jgi:hypothetical protein
MELLGKFWQFLRTRKKFWLPPVIVMAVVVGMLFAVAKAAMIVPLIYAIL